MTTDGALMIPFVGVLLFLFFAIQRPVAALSAFLPAVAGITAASAACALLHRIIPMFVLAFGGAVVILSVEQSIAFLLLVGDSGSLTAGRASREILSAGVVAALVEVIAFLTLLLSGIPLLEKLGLFVALGLSVSFLALHLLFPLMFSGKIPAPAPKEGLLVVVRKFGASGRLGLLLTGALGIIMLFCSWPLFPSGGTSMNEPQIRTFLVMLLILGTGFSVQLALIFFDPVLSGVALVPIVFSYGCLLGTLRLLGRSLDSASLMMAVIVLVMGTNFSLLHIRSFQRYHQGNHPLFELVKVAIFVTGACALIGAGCFVAAESVLLQGIGIASVGIGYLLIGTLVLLPPMVAHRLREREWTDETNTSPAAAVKMRYRYMETFPRLFAWFKLQMDPMFAELPELMRGEHHVRSIIDIGCGYGIPASWCLASFQDARVFGIEPDRERARIASKAVGRRGAILVRSAPEVPDVSVPVDIALMLDMIHYLDDGQLSLLLSRLYSCLKPSGRLYIRAAVPPEKRPSFLWWFEKVRLWILDISAEYRTIERLGRQIEQSGFFVQHTRYSGRKKELFWFAAVRR